MTFYGIIKIDEIVNNLIIPFSVIPTKAGIQDFQKLTNTMDSGFHRSDDFLRNHQDPLKKCWGFDRLR